MSPFLTRAEYQPADLLKHAPRGSVLQLLRSEGPNAIYRACMPHGDEQILKVSANKGTLRTSRRASDLARAAGVRTPRVLDLREAIHLRLRNNKTVIRDVLVETAAAGVPLRTLLQRHDPKDLVDVAEQLGNTVGRIHGVTFDEFDLDMHPNGDDERLSSFGEYCAEVLERWRSTPLRQALRHLKPVYEAEKRLFAAAHDSEGDPRWNSAANLSHGDLHGGNILVAERNSRLEEEVIDWDRAGQASEGLDLRRLTKDCGLNVRIEKYWTTRSGAGTEWKSLSSNTRCKQGRLACSSTD